MPSPFGEGGKASFNEVLTKEDYMGEGLNKGRTKRSRKLSGCPLQSPLVTASQLRLPLAYPNGEGGKALALTKEDYKGEGLN